MTREEAEAAIIAVRDDGCQNHHVCLYSVSLMADLLLKMEAEAEARGRLSAFEEAAKFFDLIAPGSSPDAAVAWRSAAREMRSFAEADRVRALGQREGA